LGDRGTPRLTSDQVIDILMRAIIEGSGIAPTEWLK
jgi:hypothetical protein